MQSASCTSETIIIFNWLKHCVRYLTWICCAGLVIELPNNTNIHVEHCEVNKSPHLHGSQFPNWNMTNQKKFSIETSSNNAQCMIGPHQIYASTILSKKVSKNIKHHHRTIFKITKMHSERTRFGNMLTHNYCISYHIKKMCFWLHGYWHLADILPTS